MQTWILEQIPSKKVNLNEERMQITYPDLMRSLEDTKIYTRKTQAYVRIFLKSSLTVTKCVPIKRLP